MAAMGSYLSFLCGCKGFGDLIVGSRIEVSGWLQNLGFFKLNKRLVIGIASTEVVF